MTPSHSSTWTLGQMSEPNAHHTMAGGCFRVKKSQNMNQMQHIVFERIPGYEKTVLKIIMKPMRECDNGVPVY